MSAEMLSGSVLLLPYSREELLDDLPKGGRAVEIGVYKGAYSREILRRAKPSHLVLVDAWQFDIENTDVSVPYKARGQISRRQFERLSWLVPAYTRFKRPFSRFSTVRALSVPAASRFQDGQFDWIYIDADHSRDGTLRDLRAWSPKVKRGGLIIGHDYIDRRGFGVREAVADFTAETNYRIIALTTDRFPTFVLANEMTGTAEAFLKNLLRRDVVYQIGHEILAAMSTRTTERPGLDFGVMRTLG